MIVADRIALWLADKGITHAFGVIGGGNVAIWDAITRLGKTQIISHHHEQAAAMAASAFYRISGQISVALVTTGAGATNAITGVVAAYMDSTPLLVISGNEESKYMDSPTRVWGLQGYDSIRVAEPFCKVVARPVAANVIAVLDDCLAKALMPRQGPIWFDCCKDTQNETI